MEDKLFMKRAIYLAHCADADQVKGNPKVGAVLVCDDKIIGEGYHQKAGKAHAEVHCIKSVPRELRHLIPKSTMYVTLEPCAHTGKTPSCAQMLAQLGLKKVVVGTLDPFPLVSGKGCEILRSAGIEVSVGLLEQECKAIAKVFLTNQKYHRPFITIKWAESADGFIDRKRSIEEKSAKISTPFIQLLTHKMRGEHLGIMIGKCTYIMDHPNLTNRLYPLLPSPEVYILDNHLSLKDELKNHSHWNLISDSYSLNKVLNDMYQDGITSLLIEGGSKVIQSFINAGLWDEIRQEIGTIKLGNGTKAPQLPQTLTPTDTLHIDGHTLLYYAKWHNSL